jgi:hypothetical protein
MPERNVLTSMDVPQVEELLRLTANAAILARQWEPELVSVYTQLAAECMFELWQRARGPDAVPVFQASVMN